MKPLNKNNQLKIKRCGVNKRTAGKPQFNPMVMQFSLLSLMNSLKEKIA